MPANVYPIYYIQVLRELEKGDKTKRELREKLGLPNSSIYRAIYRMQVDGLVVREQKGREEIVRITEKGKEYLETLRRLLST